MNRAVLYHFRLGLAFTRLSLQRVVEYPLNLASWIVFIPLQYLTSLLVLKVLVSQFQAVAGWSFEQLVFLYALGALSHSFAMTLFFPVFGLDEVVIRGGIDRLLVRPANILWQICTQSFNPLAFLEVIPAAIIVVVAYRMNGLNASPALFGKLVLIVAGATFIRGAIYLALASVSFWTKRSRPLVMGGFMLLDRSTHYPLDIYPHFVQVALTLFIPIAFINYVPAADILQKGAGAIEFPGVWILTPIIGLVIFGIAYLFFRKALSHYESSGS